MTAKKPYKPQPYDAESKQLNLSQKELDELYNVADKRVAEIIKGVRKDPTLKEMLKAAHVQGMVDALSLSIKYQL